jgi:hypothetical protein
MPPVHNGTGGKNTTQNQLSNFKLLYPVYHSLQRQTEFALQAESHVVFGYMFVSVISLLHPIQEFFSGLY